jgi:hypothetical protein
MMSSHWSKLKAFPCLKTATLQQQHPHIVLNIVHIHLAAPYHHFSVDYGIMEKKYITPGFLHKWSDEIPAKLKPKCLSNLIKSAAILSLILLCCIVIYDLSSSTRFLDDTMARWKVWSMAALPVATSGMRVLDLSTANWMVSNEAMNISVPGSLPSVVCSSPLPKGIHTFYLTEVASRYIWISSPQT